jgi:hypothetical protein
MITPQQFDNALKIIADYKYQLENGLINESSRAKFVDIHKNIKTKTFYVLQNYYKDVLNLNLERSDLKKIEIYTLQKIDFTILRGYRGFGRVAEYKLKEVIESFDNKTD